MNATDPRDVRLLEDLFAILDGRADMIVEPLRDSLARLGRPPFDREPRDRVEAARRDTIRMQLASFLATSAAMRQAFGEMPPDDTRPMAAAAARLASELGEAVDSLPIRVAKTAAGATAKCRVPVESVGPNQFVIVTIPVDVAAFRREHERLAAPTKDDASASGDR